MNNKSNRLLLIAQSAWRMSAKNKADARLNEWATAFIASQIVGKYKSDTRQLSESLGTSVDTIEHLAAAWIIFDVLRKADAGRARKNRRTFSYGRFLSLGALWTRYEFETADAFEYLENGGHIAAMKQLIEDIHNPLPEWHRRIIGLYNPIEKLITDDAPEDVKEWAKKNKLFIGRFIK